METVTAMPTKEELARQRKDDVSKVRNLCDSIQSLAYNGFDAPNEVYDEIRAIVGRWYLGGKKVQGDLFRPLRLQA